METWLSIWSIRNPQSEIRDPKSAIRNPKSPPPASFALRLYENPWIGPAK
jgi:hypothetical protein